MIQMLLLLKESLSHCKSRKGQGPTTQWLVKKKKIKTCRTRFIFPAIEDVSVTLKIPSATAFYRWIKIELDRNSSNQYCQSKG